MHHYRAERIIKTKYRETKIVNYRQGNDDSKILSTCTFLDCDEHRMDYDRQIDTTRCKCALGIQYKHESKEDIAGFISKPVARPEYGMIYQHKGMLLQNLHRRYLYILIKLLFSCFLLSLLLCLLVFHHLLTHRYSKCHLLLA